MRGSVAVVNDARPPLEPQSTYSSGYSRRSSEQTLIDEKLELSDHDGAQKSLPRQGKFIYNINKSNVAKSTSRETTPRFELVKKADEHSISIGHWGSQTPKFPVILV